VIIADFEADNKKSGLINGGKTRLISEQYANSFCYLVHWIDTGDIWALSYTEVIILPKNSSEGLIKS